MKRPLFIGRIGGILINKILFVGVVLSGYVPDLPMKAVRRCGMQRLF